MKKLEKHPRRITKIMSFINAFNWEGIKNQPEKEH